MKFKKLPSVITNQQKSLQRKLDLSSKELAHYQREKVIKDIQFFESAVPYLSGFFIGVGFVFCTFCVFNYNHKKKTGESLWNKFYFNLLDIEVVEDSRNISRIMDHEIHKIEQHFLENRQPKDLLKNINEIDNKDIREIFKKNYLPRVKSKEELMKQLKYKKSWKYPSGVGTEFNPVVPLKPKMLGAWELERVNIPQRTYERYPVSKAIKCYLPGREFGYDQTLKDTTDQYQKFIHKHKEKFEDYVQRPSKYQKPSRFLPSILQDKEPFLFKKSEFADFKFDKHTAFIYK